MKIVGMSMAAQCQFAMKLQVLDMPGIATSTKQAELFRRCRLPRERPPRAHTLVQQSPRLIQQVGQRLAHRLVIVNHCNDCRGGSPSSGLQGPGCAWRRWRTGEAVLALMPTGRG